MKRILLGLAVGALIFGVAFAGAKIATVTNPMAADLDAGGHNVTNAANYVTAAGASLGGDAVVVHAAAFAGSQDVTNPPFYALVFAGTADPSVAPPEGNNQPGSLYLRQPDSEDGQLWFKTGGCATCWVRVA